MSHVIRNGGVVHHRIWPAVVGVLLITLSGCDYWPPALQTQIEQLKADLQTITAERARLEQQVITLTRARDELQTQVDHLSRVNKERASTIGDLERALKSARDQKVAPVKAAAKPVLKPVAKKPLGKTTHATNTKKSTRPTTKKKAEDHSVYYKTIR